MVARRGFVRDEKTGRTAEERVADLFDKANFSCTRNESKKKSDLSSWDLAFPLGKQSYTIEVKYDLYEAKSGNVAVEYFNPKTGNLSGILVTTSNIWVFALADGSIWGCRTPDLKRYFENEKCVRDVSCGGDGNASMCLYERHQLFERIFFRFDNMSPEELSATIKSMVLA